MTAVRLLLPALLLVACSAPRLEEPQAVSATSDVAFVEAPPPPMEMAKQRERSRPAMAPAPAMSQLQPDRKIIQTAELRIQLEDVDAARRTADSIATALQGLVTSSRASNGDDTRREVSVTMRIPNAHFADALTALRQIGRVRQDNASGDDVTRQYNDLEIRIAVKRDLVARLRVLVASRTAKLSDVLDVERELARAVAELEQMEGERRFLDNQVAMSTIHATFFHVPVTGPGNALEPLREAVRDGIRMLLRSAAVVVSLIVFVTPWVLLSTAAWLVWRARRRRHEPMSSM